MDLPHQITGRLDDDTLRDLEQLAVHFDCSLEHLVTTAVMRFVNEESRIFPGEFDDLPAYISPDPLARQLDEASRQAHEALMAYLKPAIESADRGDLISQEEMEAWFASRGVRDAAE